MLLNFRSCAVFVFESDPRQLEKHRSKEIQFSSPPDSFASRNDPHRWIFSRREAHRAGSDWFTNSCFPRSFIFVGKANSKKFVGVENRRGSDAPKKKISCDDSIYDDRLNERDLHKSWIPLLEASCVLLRRSKIVVIDNTLHLKICFNGMDGMMIKGFKNNRAGGWEFLRNRGNFFLPARGGSKNTVTGGGERGKPTCQPSFVRAATWASLCVYT